MMIKERVIGEMKQVFEGFPQQIEHTFNVLNYADEIMNGENVSESQRDLISIVVILHDIGVIEARKKFGSSAAPYQEKEGAVIAAEILEKLGYSQVNSKRVCYIVGHHHTASKIDGLDFQILWEADLLENLKRRDVINDFDKLKEVIDKNFKTATGKNIAYKQYLKE